MSVAGAMHSEQLHFSISAVSINELIDVALQLGAQSIDGWSIAEEALAREARPVHPDIVSSFFEAIQCGEDPLGDAFCRILAPEARRPRGAS